MRPFSVLLVDDDFSTRELFEIVMAHYNMPLSLAQTESQAVEQVTKETPSVIVMDIMLPGKDGFTVLKTIRALPHGNCPVIATTAYYTPDTIGAFEERGFNGYLLKPIRPDGLIDYLAGIVNAHKGDTWA